MGETVTKTAATAVRERPILFRPELVRAILDGRKTQTRRLVKPQPVLKGDRWAWPSHEVANEYPPSRKPCAVWTTRVPCPMGMADLSPYGVPGDRLWVREPFFVNLIECVRGRLPKTRPLDCGRPCEIVYRADGEFAKQFEDADGDSVWRPSIHMPRWASRLTLETTVVRAERLQAISMADVAAEGFKACEQFEGSFSQAWDSVNGKRDGASWASSPWVWVVTFKRVETRS